MLNLGVGVFQFIVRNWKMNNNCWHCYFYKSGYMENACDYFSLEMFPIQHNCDAFSTDGHVAPELEDKIFRESDGMFGKPLDNES